MRIGEKIGSRMKYPENTLPVMSYDIIGPVNGLKKSQQYYINGQNRQHKNKALRKLYKKNPLHTIKIKQHDIAKVIKSVNIFAVI